MPTRLVRYVALATLRTFAVCLVAVVGIYLVIDFADRAKNYSGPNVVRDVAELYLCRALGVAYQLSPAAMLLGAGACISGLRQRRETTAMVALTISPRWLYAGVASACALVIGGLLSLDGIIGQAGKRADQLTSERFHQWGDYNTYFGAKQWFRSGPRIYFLRQHAGRSFLNVSVLTVTPDFRLANRVDAERMDPLPDGRWRLERGSERTFPAEGESQLATFAEREYRFPEDPSTFDIEAGRPEQISFWRLEREVATRKRLGLPAQAYELAYQNKFAYPLLGLPAALLATALALRRGRSGHLTTALMEGVAVVGLLWGISVVFKALAGSGQISAVAAAWLPVVLLALTALGTARAVE